MCAITLTMTKQVINKFKREQDSYDETYLFSHDIRTIKQLL